MRFLTLCFLSLILLSATHAADLGGVIDITPVDGWIQTEARKPGKGPVILPTVRFVPKDGRNAAVLITLFTAEMTKVNDLASLKKIHSVMCTRLLPSPDFKVRTTEFGTAHGVGVYASFEDPALIGKAPIKENYKFTAPVAVFLPEGFVLQATIFTDSMATADFQQALQIIKSAVAARPVPTSPSATAPAEKPYLEISMMPQLHAVLHVPTPDFHDFNPKLNPSPGYFSFVSEKGLMLSGWLDRAATFQGMRKFWAAEKAKLEEKAGLKVEKDSFKKVGDWDVVTYTVALDGKLSQKNLRACRVVRDTWADLHLSLSTPDATWEELENALKSVALVAIPSEVK